ncbi:MAG: hypothetical protein ACLQPD_27885 [Desulfomonilaceae bacterium]
MRPGRTFVFISLMSFFIVAVFAGSSHAQQAAGTASYTQPSPGEYTDTTVTREKSGLQASVTTAGWRHGYYWHQPQWRGYWHPYYRYGSSYFFPPYPGCCWNGGR